MNFEFKYVSSLEKIFPDQKEVSGEIGKLSALRGETVSFQIAYRSDSPIWMTAEAESEQVEIREVSLAPSELVASDTSAILRETPGLYPDPLLTMKEPIRLPPNQWRSLWVTVRTSCEDLPGIKNIAVNLHVQSLWEKDPVDVVCTLPVKLLSAAVPEQKLVHTEWFHTDCIYSFYKVPCWSEEHWNLLEKYFKNFADHGINMLLTPLWTPPLDTQVNRERPTVQLLGIKFESGKFSLALFPMQVGKLLYLI